MLPKYIGICGHPKSGKDLVGKMLTEYGHYHKIDNGGILRQAAPAIFGFDPAYGYSQEGKLRMVNSPSGPRTVRDLLGSLGNALEHTFGEEVMGWSAIKAAERAEATEGATHFVMTSCRKEEGRVYKRNGGIVIQVDRPGVGPSGHDFDLWNPDYVDHVIVNDGTIPDLEKKIIDFLRLF